MRRLFDNPAPATDDRRMKPVDPADRLRAPGSSSVLKALSLLEGVVNADRPMTLAELAALFGLPKPTAHRIALLLEREGFLEREPEGRRFVAGYRLLGMALDTLYSTAERGVRHAILKWLSEEIGESCALGVMTQGEILCLEFSDVRVTLGLSFLPGGRIPLHCSSVGKLYLGYMSRRRRERIVRSLPLKRYTDKTITDPDELLRTVEVVRTERMATDNQERIAGLVCVAVPVIGPRGRICAGIAFGVPEARLTLEQAIEHVPTMHRAAERMVQTFSPTGRTPRGEGARRAAE